MAPQSRTLPLRHLLPLAFLLLCLAALSPVCHAQAQTIPPSHLLIYAIDVEGGQSTLVVDARTHASLLVDTGWRAMGPKDDPDRDISRIQAAMADAGISRINHVLITHFHVDHVGGVPELVKRVPIGDFLDHGENREVLNGRDGEI